MKNSLRIWPFFKRRGHAVGECTEMSDNQEQQLPLTLNAGSCRGHCTLLLGLEEGTTQDVQLTMNGATITTSSMAAFTHHHQQFDCSDTTMHPIFLAIKMGDMGVLQDILQKDPKVVNSARYGGSLPLHASCGTKDIWVLKELLNHDAKVGEVNGLGQTALHLAVSVGWHEGVAQLLQQGASPDMMSKPPPTIKGVRVETPLHSAARRGDLTSTVLLLQHDPDLMLRDSDNCSVLHLAAQSRSLQVIHYLLQDKRSHRLMTGCDYEGNSVLHKALLMDCDAGKESTVQEIVEELVKAGANVNAMNKRSESPLFLAAHHRMPKVVEALVSLGGDPTLVTQRGQSVLHAACHRGCTTCLDTLLATSHVQHLVTAPDNEGREPFHYAVHSGSIDCCELLLNHGDHLTRVDRDGVSRCSLILEHLPSATQLLRRLFDVHVRLSNNAKHDADFRVTFDYSVLSSEKEGIQSSLVSELTNSRLEPLLKHPLLESFLFIKWRKIKPFFYCSVLIYFLFLLMHTSFIIITYGGNSWKWQEHTDSLAIFFILHITMFLLILIPDMIIMFANFKKYIRQWETLTKTIALGSSAVVVFSHIIPLDGIIEVSDNLRTNDMANDTMNQSSTYGSFLQNVTYSVFFVEKYTDSHIENPVVRRSAAISAFFCWVEFMMLLGRFPSLGTYVLMFSRVAQSITKFIAAFFSLIIGFAISFMVLFHKKEAFISFPHSLVKTLMMMIGEIDYSNLMEDLEMPIITCLFLVLFLFLVCVLMANLLIGLAVNDIPDLQRQGKIKRLSKQASYLVSYEKLMLVARALRCFPRQLRIMMSSRCRIPQVVHVLPNRHRGSSRKNVEQYVPSETLQEAILLGNREVTNDDMNNTEENDLLVQFKSFKLKYTHDCETLNHRLAQLPDSTATEKILKERLDQIVQIVQNQLMQLSLQIQQHNQNCNTQQLITVPLQHLREPSLQTQQYCTGVVSGMQHSGDCQRGSTSSLQQPLGTE
nr:transient receptor potential cation channel subfamily A member 1-like [Cherax quadricarinatus]